MTTRRAFVQALTFGGGALVLVAGRQLFGSQSVKAAESTTVSSPKQGVRTLNTSARGAQSTKIDWHIED